MKKIITLLLTLFALQAVQAQTNVTFRIWHRLGANPFAYGDVGTNNMPNDFKVDRLEYYISDIVLVHDGGIETPVPQTWILADGSAPVDQALGSFNITTLESVKFGIGVGPDVNHDDPSAWPSTHPLSPQNPSMHWGWNSGYRFVAMEGWAGANFSQMWQIHALGDNNYYTTEVVTAGFPQGNDLIISIYGDYARAVENIEVSTGPITHGETGEARTLLQNFSSRVFTPAPVAVGLDNSQLANAFHLYPNPSNGRSNVVFEGNMGQGMEVQVNDLTGRTLQRHTLPTDGRMHIDLPQGLYLVSLIQDNQAISTKKLIVAH